jgi:hypothetical protein
MDTRDNLIVGNQFDTSRNGEIEPQDPKAGGF